MTDALEGLAVELKGTISCEIPSIPFVAGQYGINCFVSSSRGIEDYILNCAKLFVIESDTYGTGKTVNPEWGMISLDHRWRLS
jgi:lipopolysaccharide transport system ATP-binding protein